MTGSKGNNRWGVSEATRAASRFAPGSGAGRGAGSGGEIFGRQTHTTTRQSGLRAPRVCLVRPRGL